LSQFQLSHIKLISSLHIADRQPQPTVYSVGDRAFPVASARRVWNSLPKHVTPTAVFRSRLKTHLFFISCLSFIACTVLLWKLDTV